MSELITLYGHRGGGDPYPDSSLESYTWGANWGADFLEPDVYITKDGVLVVSHDNISQGFANVTYAEAKAMNSGLLTFGEVIELVKKFSTETGRDIGIIPELKDQSYAAAQALVQTLVEHDFTDPSRVVVQSFGAQPLHWLHDTLMPAAGVDFQLALLGSGIANPADIAAYADIIAPSIGSFSAADVQAAHAAGLKVVAWTIAGSQADLQNLVNMGVDGVFVDNAQLARPGEAAIEGIKVVYGTPQWNVVTDTAGNDEIYAMQGDDIVRASAGGNDVVYGDGGNDVLFGGDGDDKLVGGSGNDYLDGGAGRDVLDGSAGNDVIVATGDEVLFRPGDGIDLVVADNASKVTFSGIKSTDVTVIQDGAYLILRAGDDALVLRDGNDAAHRPGTFTFADGVTWTGAELAVHATVGTDATVEAALPGLEFVLDRAPNLATPSTVALGTDVVAGDGFGSGTLAAHVDEAEAGAVYRLSFSLADLGGAAVKVLWNGEVLYEGTPDAAGSALHFVVVGGSGDGSDRLVFEGAANPGVFDAALSDVHLVKLADPGVPVPDNAAPVAQAGSLELSQDLTYTGTIAATDADGDPLVYSLGEGPAHGTLKLNADGTYTYTPNAGFTGADGFTYIVNDGHGGVAEAAIDLAIKPGVLIGADLVVNGSFEQFNATIPSGDVADWGYRNSAGIIPGWTDANSNRIEQHWDAPNGVNAEDGRTWIDMDGYNTNTHLVQTIAHVETGATYELSFSIADADTAASDDGIQVYFGGQLVWQGLGTNPWQDFTFRVVGGSGDGSNKLEFVATGTNLNTYGTALDDVHFVKIAEVGQVLPDNVAPDAVNGSDAGQAVVSGHLKGTDTNGDVLAYALKDAAAHGTVVVKADGTYTYTANAGFTGNDTFTFTVDDGHGGKDTATQTVTIKAQVAPGTNLIVNGGFEDLTGADNAADWGYRNTSPAGVIPGWTNVGDNRAEVHKDHPGGVNAAEGTYWFDLAGAPTNAKLVQSVAGIEAGLTYQLKFSLYNTDTAGQAETVKVYWGNQLVYTGSPVNRWQEITVDVIGGAGDGSNKLTFESVTPSQNNDGIALDKVSLIQIEENPNLIVNGSFEDLTGADNLGSWGYRNTSPQGVIAGWTNASAGSTEVHWDTVNGIKAKDGSNWFDMEAAPQNAKLSQTVAGVAAGQTYELKFSVAETDTAQQDSIKVYWGGQLVYTGSPARAWQEITLHVVGGAGDGSNKLTFESTAPSPNGAGVALDDISLRKSIEVPITGTMGADTLGGTAGHDVFDAGRGDDILAGGADADTYRYFSGGGSDTIVEAAGASGTDVLAFQDLGVSGIAGAHRHGNDVEIDLADGSVILLKDQLVGGGVEMVTFADGTVVRSDQLAGLLSNRAPVAGADVHPAAVNEDGASILIPLAQLLANATDADLDTLTITGLRGDAVGGTAVLTAEGVRFTLAPDFNGQASFSYTVDDGHGGSVVAHANFAVNPVNDAPVVTPTDPVTTDEDVPVSGRIFAADVDGDALTYVIKGDGAAHGTVTIDANGAWTYTPAANVSGADSFTVTVSDGHVSVDTTVSLTINPVNDLPVTVADAATVGNHGTGTYDLVANDTDVEDGRPLLTGFTVTGVEGLDLSAQDAASAFRIVDGKLIFAAGGLFASLDQGQHATVTLAYTATDHDGGQSAGQFTLTVTGDLHRINGTAGADTLYDTQAADHIVAGAGNDVIYSNAGRDYIEAGDGNDTVYGTSGDKTVHGGAGDDTIYGGGGTSLLFGDAGNDRILGSYGNETIAGGDGNDMLSGGGGSDTLSGGAGDDSVSGSYGNDVISGGDGNDTLVSGGGNDLLSGGAGNDRISGDYGNDVITGDDGNDVITGGGGNDTLSGGAGDDSVTGSYGNDVITGGGGNDVITGGGGNDLLSGGAGNDRITGDYGNDVIAGDDGNDVIVGGGGNDTLSGGAGDDSITGSYGNDIISGGDGNDMLVSGGGTDTITGGAGNDVITGNYGNSTLDGGDGNDRINGGTGNEVIAGGKGDDLLYGGAGSDTFVFGKGDGHDVVGDFKAGAWGNDVVQLDHAAFADFAALLASGHVQDATGGVVISYDDGSSLTLAGVTKASLDSHDFIFS